MAGCVISCGRCAVGEGAGDAGGVNALGGGEGREGGFERICVGV